MLRMLKLLFAFTFSVGLASWALSAEDVSIEGSSDPAFRELMTTWLLGYDEAALNGLAELAHEDHLAAQIFLGQITGVARHTSDHILLGLDRSERQALTAKDDGSRFGIRWLRVAQDRHPLAWSLANYGHVERYQKALEYFLEHGEVFMQATVLPRLVSQGQHQAVLNYASKGQINEFYKPIVATFIRVSLFLGYPIPGGPEGPLVQEYASTEDITSKRQLEFTFWGRPKGISRESEDGKQAAYVEAILRDAALLGRLEKYAQSDIRLKPALELCSRICPGDAVSCTVALKAHIFVYSRFWSSSHSPVEALLATSDYRDSARYPADMRRLLLQSEHNPSDVQPLDACFAHYLGEPG